MASMADLDALIAALYQQGVTAISAARVAEHLWPDGRRNNANGQVFHLSAGVAGRMLRRSRLVWEFEPRHWEIVPEYIESAA